MAASLPAQAVLCTGAAALFPCKRLIQRLERRRGARSRCKPGPGTQQRCSIRYPHPAAAVWPIFVPFALLVALAVIWTGLWFYAASAAETAIAGWRAREAKSGRTYECGSQSISGFPFRIEVQCTKPVVEWRGKGTQLVAAQGRRPGDAGANLPADPADWRVQEPDDGRRAGQPPAYVVNWTLGQSSMRGTPRAPQRGSLVFDNLNGAAARPATRRLPNASAPGAARPHGGRLRQRQSGDRSRPARDRCRRSPEVHPHRRESARRRRGRDAARACRSSRRNRGRRVSGNCRRAAAASTSPTRACSRAR